MIEALILSFFLYALYIVLIGTVLPIEWAVTVDADKVSHYAVAIHRWRVLGLTTGAVVLGLAWGLVRSTDGAFRVLRKLRLTEKTNGETVWNDVFYSLEGTVQVGLGDGRIVRGWLSRYSDGAGERSVFLEKASWIAEDAAIIDIPGPAFC